ncbi:hypothetical protein CBLAS_1042 [Campylobacter blaseri]|nr:hypothetical protein CBLAS_1042 [Campylobacter blaseri]
MNFKKLNKILYLNTTLLNIYIVLCIFFKEFYNNNILRFLFLSLLFFSLFLYLIDKNNKQIKF